MGKELGTAVFSPHDRVLFRRKVRCCVDVLTGMLASEPFGSGGPTTGLEIEINLVDAEAAPAMRNAEILADLGDPRFQPELSRFNLELNVPPRLVSGDGLGDYEQDILDALRAASECAGKGESRLALIGMLPTVRPGHLVLANLSDNERFRALDREIAGARGDDFRIDIDGTEHLVASSDTIAPEGACTSTQFHIQVAPADFARYWNASQAIAGVQLALGANSPYLYGRRLWAETRIPFFEQATDARPDEFSAQGVRPRVWFGDRWIDSVLDLYEENLRYFPPLLPELSEEDPVAVRACGNIPHLYELRMHNGTVYRWNRPVYDVSDGRPHLRVENRVLPSGPSVADLVANAAFYFGLVRQLVEEDPPIWARLAFATAEANFRAGARDGIEADLTWPGRGEVAVTDLVRDVLLPRARTGLDLLGVRPAQRDRLLGIIADRCRTGRNGATWQTAAVGAAEARGLSRAAALCEMTQRYLEYQRSNEPVHTWPI
ncbi:glutamate--cysteine ligase [Actinoplanes sp. NEAU-A12]|uniref:Glutamate--cysteine ligase n=1 Tax=Actinoplanes sandaracinus TaxID=3045177 RepID=A0ABT6WTG3_9ACTN|nr:glutamate--cysteine ligase [Actinoplanes sandaracinus]MDI6099041.1 glutamate--cysteine ligase [Actinoplanes sandaracinus]MDI6102936.1 glutamate--cysteine ligase [Actinoplanes sandaracinus]